MFTFLCVAIVQGIYARWFAFGLSLVLSLLMGVMIGYITKITEVLKGGYSFAWKLEQKQKPTIEIGENGFWLKHPWTLLSDKFVSWASVSEIHAQMCESFVGHYLCLQFVIEQDKKALMVDDSMRGWDILYIEVLKKFPDFNVENFKRVESLFPKEGSLECWKRRGTATE